MRPLDAGAASKAVDADPSQLDEYQRLVGPSFADRVNSRFWKPSGATHDLVQKPLAVRSPWENPHAWELARHRALGGRMQVDSIPDQLSRGDMYLYNSMNDRHEEDGPLSRTGTVWQVPGLVRDGPAMAGLLVMRPDGDTDNMENTTGAAPNIFHCHHSFRMFVIMVLRQWTDWYMPRSGYFCEQQVSFITPHLIPLQGLRCGGKARSRALGVWCQTCGGLPRAL